MPTLRNTLLRWFRRMKSSMRIVWGTWGRTSSHWRTLYVAAVFETDDKRTLQRIGDARTALIQRARELFQSAGNHLPEESAIDDALIALRALERSVVHLRTHPR